MDNKQIEIIMEDLDETNISSILKKWHQISIIKKQLGAVETQLKTKIKNYLKERKWEQYKDTETDINITLSKVERRDIDRDVLKDILDEQQLAQIYKTIVYEKLNIMTPERREVLKKYVKNNKSNKKNTRSKT